MLLKVFQVCRRLGPTEIYAAESLKQMVSVLNDTFGDEGQYTSEVTQVTELYQKVRLVVEPTVEKEIDG